MATNLLQIETESEIKQRLESERARLRKIAGLDRPEHFHRPVERAFTAEERGRVTILFGGFTWKHEDLIRAVFQGCGYRCEKLPVPDVPAFQKGKEYGNNGQCNPTYFTVGNLVQYLQFRLGQSCKKPIVRRSAELRRLNPLTRRVSRSPSGQLSARYALPPARMLAGRVLSRRYKSVLKFKAAWRLAYQRLYGSIRFHSARRNSQSHSNCV